MSRLLLLLALWALPARAEVPGITFATQYGLAYLPFMVMQEDRLIEKHAAALGLPEFKVDWTTVTSGAVANDGLLSGRLAFGVGATPAMLLLWDRTRASANPVRGVVGVAVMPTVLNTRDPAVQSVKDLTERNKIALPAIKVSNHALVLQMEAAALFGPDSWNRFDTLTVALPSPDAAAQLMSRNGQVDSVFASPPFAELVMAAPGVHTILSSVDVMGDTSLTVLWTTQKFVDANPTVVQAVSDAIKDALAGINADKTAAAARYLHLSGDKIPLAELLRIMEDPHIRFSPVPLGTMAFAGFMRKTGALRSAPAAWTDVYLPIAHSMPGN